MCASVEANRARACRLSRRGLPVGWACFMAGTDVENCSGQAGRGAHVTRSGGVRFRPHACGGHRHARRRGPASRWGTSETSSLQPGELLQTKSAVTSSLLRSNGEGMREEGTAQKFLIRACNWLRISTAPRSACQRWHLDTCCRYSLVILTRRSFAVTSK